MFIDDKELTRFSTNPAIQKFEAEREYSAQTPLACFYQGIIRQTFADLKQTFFRLPTSDKHLIYELAFVTGVVA